MANDSPLWTPQTLVLSGNEITDAVRAAGISGDGRQNDSSVGIWPTVTNLCTNSSFETDLSGWQTTGVACTFSRITSDYFFGSACAQVTCTGTQYGGAQFFINSTVAGTVYTYSVWVNRTETVEDWRIDFQTALTGNVVIPKVLGWQRVQISGISSGTTALGVRVINYSAGASSTIKFDGVQIETAPTAASLLTVSGNEITDAVRAAGVSGDGRSNDSSFGIWPAVTNLISNSSFETDLSGWIDQGTGVTRTRDTTTHKFGAASQKIVTNGASAYQGTGSPVCSWNIGDTLTASVWIYGVAGQKMRGVIYDGTTYIRAANADIGVTLIDGWQRITWSGTALSASTTGRIYVDTGVGAQTVTWYIDGVQLEKGAVAAPLLTVSGNEITDAVRAAGVSGDGRQNDSSFGIWPASNPIWARDFGPGVESWQNDSSGSTITQSTDHALFRTHCLKMQWGGTNSYGVPNAFTPAAASTQYTATLWIQRTELTDTFNIYVQDNTYAAMGFFSTPAATLAPQKLTCTFTTAGGTTGLRPVIQVIGTSTAVFYVLADWCEPGPISTPFPGDGSTRAAARVQIPASALNPTQMWAAFKVRMGVAGGTVTTAGRTFGWTTVNAANRIDLSYDSGNSAWSFLREAGAVVGNQVYAAYSATVGDIATVIVSCTSTTLGLSLNGAAFTTAANSNAPTGLPALVDIGSLSNYSTGYELRGDILWACFGTGTLSNADATALNALGRDPVIADFSTANAVTTIWTADSVVYGNPRLPTAIATPYTPSSRAAARVQIPASSLNPTQGWAAFKVRVGYPTGTGQLSIDPRIFSWTDGTANNRIDLVYITAGNYFELVKEGAGLSTSTVTSNYLNFVAGSQHTIIVYWTSSTLGVSFDGTAFNTVANPQIPSGLQSLLDIGSFLGGSQSESDIFWACFGTGTISNTDAAALAALNRDPQVTDFSPTNAVTVIAPMDTVVYGNPSLPVAFSTPYIETHGSTASRGAPRIQIPSAALNPVQMWMAFRLRMGFSSHAAPFPYPILFFWQLDANNYSQYYYDVAGQVWARGDVVGGVASYQNISDSFAVNDIRTLIFSSTQNSIGISVNGSPLQMAPRLSPLPPIPAMADIGTQVATSPISSDILWVSSGTGTLTNQDIARLAASADPSTTFLESLNSANSPSRNWPAGVGETSYFIKH